MSGAGLLDFPQLLAQPRTRSLLRRSRKYCFGGKILKMDTVPVRSGALFNFLCKPIEKCIAFEPRSGSKSQLYSQSKLTTLRRKNRKIQHENEILKAETIPLNTFRIWVWISGDIWQLNCQFYVQQCQWHRWSLLGVVNYQWPMSLHLGGYQFFHFQFDHDTLLNTVYRMSCYRMFSIHYSLLECEVAQKNCIGTL
jgi:hypothetical protein